MDSKDFALPDAVDVVLLGTGLPECILAAALARAGLSVLHFDKNEYYGGYWASFSFDQLQKWVSAHLNVNVQRSEIELSGCSTRNGELECIIEDDNWSLVQDLAAKWHIPESVECEPVDPATALPAEVAPTQGLMNISRQFFKEKSRYFNIDLAPKLIFASGKTTEILLQSGVSQYMEFKSIDRVLTFYNEKLEKVPMSRNEVFQSKEVDLIDKRMLMKVLTLCWEYESHRQAWENFEHQPVEKFLEDRQLTSRVKHYLLNAIGMAYPGMSTVEFLHGVNKMMKSCGVFGCKTSFLWPLYGCGDLAQAFSRSCAVFGGIYCLRCPVQAWLTLGESEKVSAVIVHGKRIDCKYLISTAEYIPQCLRRRLLLSGDKTFCRAILLTDGSLMPDAKHHISLLNYTPVEGGQRVLLLETGYSALVSPQDIYIVYLWTSQPSDQSEQAIRSCIAKFFVICDNESEPSSREGRPRVLWSAVYKHRYIKVAEPGERSCFKNVVVTNPPSSDWDLDGIIEKAESNFRQCLPDAPFFPQEVPLSQECAQAGVEEDVISAVHSMQ